MDAFDGAHGGAEALLECVASRAAAQMGAENFPVALRLLPRQPRSHLARVYAFARFVDDVGDTAPGDRDKLLDLIEQDVRDLRHGGPRLTPVAALSPVVDGCGVPLEPFLDLIEANRVDQHTLRYETFEDLLGYCKLSAAPIGRIVLHTAGAATARNVVESDEVCAALQVLEHCQDTGEDARAGRIYLPAVDLRAAGVPDEALLAAESTASLRAVVAVQVDRAAELLRAGRPLVRRLSGWSRVAVAGYVAGGLATVAALRKAHHDVLSGRIRPARTGTAVRAIPLVMAPGARWTR
jgi:squalene synthase HpnC